ncbi:DUF938 domain-containing protein [Bradyrhizobium sp. NAS96.2]|uniref:DUF938 domain-containing protein n=1 Tax=Bradyrhizobium sp. NAS96.2 TaxID=1680160 RepID=UPI000A96BA0D|nr:DUF938 domain-containing protein [Bradyrhizobium sp. NAS96.2]
MFDARPIIDPYPLRPYVGWAGNRNKDAILKACEELFPTKGDALEIATGAGLHINYLAPHFLHIRFQPSDYDQGVFETIKRKRLEGDNNNVADPVLVDLTVPSTWPDAREQLYDVIFVINIFHVAPVSIAEGIAALGAKLLKPTGFIAIYGPFKIDGYHVVERGIRQGDSGGRRARMGLKDVRDIEREARKHGLALKRRLALPASNFILVFGGS